MEKPNILIGCDPELFVYSANKKKVISAHDLLPGTKKEPFKVPAGAIQVDGVAAEFNIEPAADKREFLLNLHKVRSALKEKVDEKAKENNDVYSLVAKPCVFFTKAYWETVPESAKELGCEADYNAYTMQANPKPDSDLLMRTGSGHVHISWGEHTDFIDDDWLDKAADLVRHLDQHLLPEADKWDNDKLRRRLYGMPGAFRPKLYGVEYRTLSNAWLNSYRTAGYVFDAVQEITKNWLAGKAEKHYKIAVYTPAMELINAV